jgi:choline monooxygenase
MTQLVSDPLGDLDEVAAQVADGHSIPYAWYGSPEVFRFEVQNILRQSWHVAGPLAKVARPGDHFCCEASGVPIAVVRGQDDRVRAFVNVCRHRGYQVVRSDGNRRALQCRYHAWTYNLDGTLKGAPGCELDPAFERDEVGLLPVSVDILAGVVFVNPDPDAPALCDAHPTIASWVTSLQLDLSEYAHLKQTTFQADGNWKLVYENASECYHCPTIHPTSLTSVYDPRGEREICDEALVVAHAPRLDRGGRGIRAIMAFPGFVVQQDDYIGVSAQIIADAPGRTRLVADLYANPDCPEGEIAEHTSLWERTFDEDMDVVEVVSRGVTSGAISFGRLIAPKEERTVHIQRLMVDAYRQAADALRAT